MRFCTLGCWNMTSGVCVLIFISRNIATGYMLRKLQSCAVLCERKDLINTFIPTIFSPPPPPTLEKKQKQIQWYNLLGNSVFQQLYSEIFSFNRLRSFRDYFSQWFLFYSINTTWTIITVKVSLNDKLENIGLMYLTIIFVRRKSKYSYDDILINILIKY